MGLEEHTHKSSEIRVAIDEWIMEKNIINSVGLSAAQDIYICSMLMIVSQKKNVICVLDSVRSFVRSENYTAVTRYV